MFEYNLSSFYSYKNGVKKKYTYINCYTGSTGNIYAQIIRHVQYYY